MSFSVDRCAAALAELTRALPAPVSGYCVALSGGLDSVVLLQCLAASSGAGLPLRAVHVDHGLSASSAEWARWCVRHAAALGVDCEVVGVDARAAPGESPEAAARAARYEALARTLREREALLTAHHADDQLETVLLQLMRGGGLRGLAAMPPAAPFARGWHLRPLLAFERVDLKLSATAAGLEWLDDPSNEDLRFDRNYLRREIVPRLRQRWPGLARAVGRGARHAAQAVVLEDEVGGLELARVRAGRTLALDRLRELPAPAQGRVVRAWLREQQLPLPPARTLAALLHDSDRAAADRVPVTRWPGARVHRYRAHLYAEPSAWAEPRVGACEPGTPYDLGSGQTLEWRAATGLGLSRRRLAAPVEIALRVGGERIRPAGSAHTRTLRKWLQERGVVPWRRDSLPLVVSGGRLAAIGDLVCLQEFAAQPGEPSWQLAWQGRPLLLEAEFLTDDDAGGTHGG
jgi:tRNA(Ile)-lysidine synthase